MDADRTESTCKRLDHKYIKFAFPWFKSYDCGQLSGTVCNDFEPSDTVPWLKAHWKGWSDYWEDEDPTKGKIWLILDDDRSVRYAVSRKDFVEGSFLDEEGNLKWIEKEYYKMSRSSPTGYILVHERNENDN